MIATYSCSAATPSDTKPMRRLWRRISNAFRSRTTDEAATIVTSPSLTYSKKIDLSSSSSLPTTMRYRRQKHFQSHTSLLSSWKEEEPIKPVHSPPMIPPYSPTYCQPDCFPYSNFYVKLPDGRWMVRFRDGNRDILRTDVIDGNFI
ncbi:hypothetical protein [Absidia glauca]|uniref:Uncharacterized protein n=1 Tax=Absidia glauca TaxID=4829 RepID=A0A168SCC7_ABSGL|nr:hypothetical protein [Absidia glauca]